MDIIIVSLLLIIATIIFTIISKKSKIPNNLLDTVPTPPGLPIIGHVLEIRSTRHILDKTREFIENYGYTFRVQAVVFQVLVSLDQKFIEFILNRNLVLKKSLNYNFLYPWLGTGLLTSDGAKWKKHRKIITPAFHFTILKRFVKTFESAGDILIGKLKQTDSVDIYPLISLCTLDVICETAMGTKINAQKHTTSDYVSAVKEICKIIIERSLSPIEIFNATFRFTKTYRKQMKFINILHSHCREVIKQKTEQIHNDDKQQKLEINAEDDVISKKSAFLDILLDLTNAEQSLTNEELREEVDTFMFEGHDTSAVSISFTLYCLANHPEFQEKVYNEQMQLFNNERNPLITYDDLNNMKYLELVIKESLRLYPSVPFIGRYATEDIQFENMIIPKYTNIVFPIFFIHRNPAIFKDPEVFNPERFRNFDGTKPFAYIPFSAGPRNCIGQKFAMLEMKSVISKIVRNFELLPAKPHHQLELATEIVLKSVSGIKIGIRPRN